MWFYSVLLLVISGVRPSCANLTSVSDTRVLVTTNQFDAVGQLLRPQVIGATPFAINVTGFDRRGNPILKIDELANSFTNVFDGLDRVKAAFGPTISGVVLTNLPPPPGGTNTRAYNALTGLLQTKTDGRGVTCTHYFDDFLRPASNIYSGPLPEHNLTTVFSYDARSSLIGISENFTNNTAGPSVSLTRSYDSYGKLIGDAVSGGAAYAASQAWDSAGRRIGIDIGTAGYGFSWRADGKLISVGGGSAGGASYTYDAAGQLLTRSCGVRTTSIMQRDGDGRPLAVNTIVNGPSVFSETLSWTPDGLLSTHTAQRPDFTDSRSYAYASLSRRLTQETVGLKSGTSWTNVFAYDYGVPGNAGVLTHSGEAVGTNVVWNGGMDVFSRVNTATDSVAQRQAYGMLNGTATMTAFLDGNPMPVTTVGTNDIFEWRAQLSLQPGPHQLSVYATNWSGCYTASASNTFTNNAVDHILNTYAGNGEVTGRVWTNSIGTTIATQSLSWDAKDRLHGVTYLDNNNNGYVWSAIYDGLGRRLSTTTVFITNGVTVSSLPRTISQYFDPSVRFLELGETDSGITRWKIYGPDLNGVYGGMQGVGGLEAVVSAPSQASPIVNDIRGNGYAIYNLNSSSLTWYSSRPTAYGAVDGYRPLPLADGATVGPASAWRGKWPDITGLYWLGNRYYDPIAGNWLGADPLGHDADPSLYTFCGGDPVNFFDSDGSLSAQASTAATVGTANAPWQIGMTINPNVFPPQTAIGAQGAPSYVPQQPFLDPNKPSTFSIQSLDIDPAKVFFYQNIVAPVVIGAATSLATEGLGFAASLTLGSIGESAAVEGGIQFASTTGGDPAFFINAAKSTPVDGMLDVAVHGAPMSVDIGSQSVNWRVLSNLIENNADFTGQEIRLLSCNTGSLPDGFAQNLANKLGVPVSAPNDVIWAFPNGNLTIGPLPNINSGSFIRFVPGGGHP